MGRRSHHTGAPGKSRSHEVDRLEARWPLRGLDVGIMDQDAGSVHQWQRAPSRPKSSFQRRRRPMLCQVLSGVKPHQAIQLTPSLLVFIRKDWHCSMDVSRFLLPCWSSPASHYLYLLLTCLGPVFLISESISCGPRSTNIAIPANCHSNLIFNTC